MLFLSALSGCSSLLPRGSSDTPSPFASFEQAQAAVEKIVALQTRTSELKALGFDLQGSNNVTSIDRVEKQTNPLGPLQPAGEAAGAALLR